MAAEAGDEDALCNFGYCTLNGNGIERNPNAGLELLKIAESAGSVDALARLGDCYLRGKVVEEDKEQAFHLYSKAAEQKKFICNRVCWTVSRTWMGGCSKQSERNAGPTKVRCTRGIVCL